MRLTPLVAAGGLTFALLTVPMFAQTPKPAAAQGLAAPAGAPAKAELPLSRVVLFNSGVGYFHREGTVDGNAQVDIRVAEEDVNDLIKSLIAKDADGGTARAVAYDNKAPAEVTLKAFRIDLTENPSVGRLLHQVRGEIVEITEKAGTVTTGQIISVDRPEAKVVTTPGTPSSVDPETGESRPGAPAKSVVLPLSPDAVEQVNILNDDGVSSVPISRIKKVKFGKAELQTEFKAALQALAAARGNSTKGVGVTFSGNGKRRVSLGYVTEAPLWKPSYRISLDADKARVQGWAAVENTTDEDWKDVNIRLVSGRPMTFQMDLYDPLFIPRPTIEPELFASLRPPVYQGTAAQQFGNLGGAGQLGGPNQFGGAANLGIGGGIGGFGGRTHAGVPGSVGGISRPSVRSLLGNRLGYAEFEARTQGGQFGGGGFGSVPAPTSNTALASNLGEAFEYTIAQPVSLARFKSALLPVLNEPMEVSRVSIYNETVQARHPLMGVRLVNKSKFFLAQGPVTVYDKDTFAGDARLPDVKPGETRLLSYAVDLGVEVRSDVSTEKAKPHSVKLKDGAVLETDQVRETTKYAVRNRTNEPRTVLITRAKRASWKVVAPEKGVEKTPDLYRVEVKVPANDVTVVDVIEEGTQDHLFPAKDLTTEVIDRLVKLPTTPEDVKAVLNRIKTERDKLAATSKAIATEEAALKAIGDDQTRIRANIERVPKDSQAYQRYLKKFDDQESEIEKRQAKLEDLRAEREQHQKAAEAALAAVKSK